MLITRLVTPPAEEPVSLYEAVAHLRVDGEDEDALIAGLITAARQMVERLSSLALVDRTVDIVMDGFPPRGTPLPLAPLRSVASITYRDASGVDQVLDPSEYRVLAGTPGRVEPVSSWPSPSGKGAVTIRAVFGHGTAADVPQLARQAILLLVGHWYEHREAVLSAGTPREVPLAADSLIALLRWSHYS